MHFAHLITDTICFDCVETYPTRLWNRQAWQDTTMESCCVLQGAREKRMSVRALQCMGASCFLDASHGKPFRTKPELINIHVESFIMETSNNFVNKSCGERTFLTELNTRPTHRSWLTEMAPRCIVAGCRAHQSLRTKTEEASSTKSAQGFARGCGPSGFASIAHHMPA